MAYLAGQRVRALGLSLATDPPVFTGTQTTAQSIPNNAFTPVTIDSEVTDTAGGHDNTTNPTRYTCQVAGVYLLSGVVVFPTTATGTRGCSIGLNGSVNGIAGSEALIAPSPGFATTIVTPPTYQRLAVGDYVSLLAFQNSGAALNTSSVGAARTSFSALWVSN